MNKDQKILWDKLMKAWNNNNSMLHLHYSEEYTRSYPNDMYGWIALADILSGFALFDDAKKALDQSLNVCPKGKEYQIYEQFGHLYEDKSNPKEAEKWYMKAVEEHERQENLIFLGAFLASQGRFNEAKIYHKKAANLKPDSADEAFYNLGLIFRAERKYKEAIEFFNKAIEIDSEYKAAIKDKEELLEYLKMLDNSGN